MNNNINRNIHLIPPDHSHIKGQIYVSYINVDSRYRQKKEIPVYDDLLLEMPSYPLQFTNQSNKINILTQQSFQIGDKIHLNNVISKNCILKDATSMKKNSHFMRIHHPHHGISFYSLFQNNISDFEPVYYVGALPFYYTNDVIIHDEKQYYIWKGNKNLNLKIQISNYKEDSIWNIPINEINDYHTVYLIFYQKNKNFYFDHDNYLIKLSKKASINYSGNGTIFVKYQDLYGIPLNELNKIHEVISLQKDSFTIQVPHTAIVDPSYYFYQIEDIDDVMFIQNDEEFSHRGGGSHIYGKKINFIPPFYSEPNHYVFSLEKTYRNVVQANIVSSLFPLPTLFRTEKKLYWRNKDEEQNHSISIPSNYYNDNQLAKVIQGKMNEKGPYFFEVEISFAKNEVSFKAYKEVRLNNRDLYTPPSLIMLQLSVNIEGTLLVYLTPASWRQGGTSHSYYHLYKNNNTQSNIVDVNLEIYQSVIIHFSRKKENAIIEINQSINTSTHLVGATYDDRMVTLHSHQLKLGDIIITDKFISGTICFFEIISITDEDHFQVERKSGYQMFFDDMFIGENKIISINEGIIIKVTAYPSFSQFLYIHHRDHQLVIGQEIIISGSTNISLVPASVINRKHVIHQIINKDLYQIMLDPYTPLNCFIPEGHGSIIIRYSSQFQLLFNYPDTIGEWLGFDHVGEKMAITIFSHHITNETPYKDLGRNSTSIQRRDNYFYLVCPELATYDNKPNQNIFAKINTLPDHHGTLINTFVPSVSLFNTPITKLTELHISFIDPDGEPVNFKGQDHSFVLELIEVYGQPPHTNVNVQTRSQIVVQ